MYPAMETATTRRRITRACDPCHSRGVKCTPSQSHGICSQCISYGSTCTYNRPAKRRGPLPGSRSTASSRASEPRCQQVHGSPRQTEYREVVDHETVLQLADFYYRVVYPILLYFHWPTFSGDLRAKRYMHDRSFYALTMAVCATASARIQERAPLPPSFPNLDFASIPPSKVFYQECTDALNALKDAGVDFNLMRTEALLGMLDLQYNDLGGCVGHLHRYLAMSAKIGFHDEANWPLSLTEIDVQERRRLVSVEPLSTESMVESNLEDGAQFWQCYHFDVYLAVTFGCPRRQRGSNCSVRYPTEVYDDDEITETGIMTVTNDAVSFIRGWNFVTDLYRILEHVSESRRTRETDLTRPSSNLGLLFFNQRMNRDGLSESDILLAAQRDWEALSTELKTAHPMTGDIIGDRYGFQAANIIITMTTVKMVITMSEDHTLVQRCALVGELLDNLSSIPTIYVQATSTAMLHHLAGVGHLLSSITNNPLSPWMYLQVRSAILAMADLIDSLQAALNSDINISSKLREHVQRTDTVMDAMKKTNSNNHVLHSALPAGVSCISAKTPSQKGDQDLLKTVNNPASNVDPFYSTNPDLGTQASPVEYQTGEIPTNTTSWPSGPSPPPVQFPSEPFLEWPREFGCGSAFYYLGDGSFAGFPNNADSDLNLV